MENEQNNLGNPQEMSAADKLSSLQEEIADLRKRLQDAPLRVRALEEKLLEVNGQLTQALSRNEKLTFTLQQAREHIATLREEVEKLTQPPSAYGVFLHRNDDDTVDIVTSGRKMRVAVHPDIDIEGLRSGQEVALNESFAVIQVREREVVGEIVTIKDILEDDTRALILGRADEERVAEISDELKSTKLRVGDTVLFDSRTNLLLEKLPRPEVEELVLEEVPDVTYEDVGGLDRQIEEITDAVELPFLHRALFSQYKLPAPKGILLYGPLYGQLFGPPNNVFDHRPRREVLEIKDFLISILIGHFEEPVCLIGPVHLLYSLFDHDRNSLIGVPTTQRFDLLLINRQFRSEIPGEYRSCCCFVRSFNLYLHVQSARA